MKKTTREGVFSVETFVRPHVGALLLREERTLVNCGSEMTQPMRTAALGLYRDLRRQGARLMRRHAAIATVTAASQSPMPVSNLHEDYNYRDYALRRARKGFEVARAFSPEEAEAAFEKGKQQLEVVRRQAIISQLYPHKASVMETTIQPK